MTTAAAGERATVAFDAIGTLFSLEAVGGTFENHGLPARTTETWMAQALRDYFAYSHAGGYIPLAEILRAALPRALAPFDIEDRVSVREDLLDAFEQLDPAEGAKDALRTATDAGCHVVVVTNGGRDSTESRLRRSGLDSHVRTVISCDELEVSKPHPRVYEAVRGATDAVECWLVAAHAWDVAGAQRQGLRTAWIASLEGTYLDAYPSADIEALDLSAAVVRILDGSRGGSAVSRDG